MSLIKQTVGLCLFLFVQHTPVSPVWGQHVTVYPNSLKMSTDMTTKFISSSKREHIIKETLTKIPYIISIYSRPPNVLCYFSQTYRQSPNIVTYSDETIIKHSYLSIDDVVLGLQPVTSHHVTLQFISMYNFTAGSGIYPVHSRLD